MIFGYGDVTNSLTVCIESITVAILSVSSGTGGTARFAVDPGTTVPVGWAVKLTGFIVNTAYNHSALVTASAAGWFETSVAFGTSEAGTSAANFIKLNVGVNEGSPFTNSSELTYDTGLFDDGDTLEIAWAVIPGASKVRLWVNGKIIDRDDAGAFTTAVWANDEAGSFAAAPLQTYLGVPVASRIAPSGFSVIEPLSIFTGQVPRHFF